MLCLVGVVREQQYRLGLAELASLLLGRVVGSTAAAGVFGGRGPPSGVPRSLALPRAGATAVSASAASSSRGTLAAAAAAVAAGAHGANLKSRYGFQISPTWRIVSRDASVG